MREKEAAVSCSFFTYVRRRKTLLSRTIGASRSSNVDVTSNDEVDANRKANGKLHDRCIIVSFFRNIEKILHTAVAKS